jgi:hypothetical protein
VVAEWVPYATGAGGVLITASASVIVARINNAAKRQERREGRVDDLFDKGMELARDPSDPEAWAQARLILTSLIRERSLSPEEAKVAGDIVERCAAKELAAARSAEAAGKRVRFWKRVAVEPSQGDDQSRRTS